MGLSIKIFIGQLTQCGLLEESEIQSVYDKAGPEAIPDAESLAHALVKAKVLTRFQAAAAVEATRADRRAGNGEDRRITGAISRAREKM